MLLQDGPALVEVPPDSADAAPLFAVVHDFLPLEYHATVEALPYVGAHQVQTDLSVKGFLFCSAVLTEDVFDCFFFYGFVATPGVGFADWTLLLVSINSALIDKRHLKDRVHCNF